VGTEYDTAEDGEWMVTPLKGHRIACCDCGLAHDYEFRINEQGRIELRVKRNNRATAQIRRHLKK